MTSKSKVVLAWKELLPLLHKMVQIDMTDKEVIKNYLIHLLYHKEATAELEATYITNEMQKAS